MEELELLRESSPVLAGFRTSDLQATPPYSASILSKVSLPHYINSKVYILCPGSPGVSRAGRPLLCQGGDRPVAAVRAGGADQRASGRPG